MTDRPPLPPFDLDGALAKVQAAEDAWNTGDPERVAGAYTVDSVWRNRDAFFTRRAAIIEFLTAKWRRERFSSEPPIDYPPMWSAGGPAAQDHVIVDPWRPESARYAHQLPLLSRRR